MSDSFTRIAKQHAVYLIIDGNELIATAALNGEQRKEVGAEWERQGCHLMFWTPSVGDRVAFCEDGGGTGEVVAVLSDGDAVRVRFDGTDSEETWDANMFDPLKVEGYEGELEVC